jgi:dihydroneopterin aldolase/2-amino-4-hydroxy-6-hydroxymethyldihydropteridine diphosphokinase/dihydropteroate synthase/2-amino-4-hydroxy-6-hydroxymethyldihydropteridine diphosphokinase/dihydropteroate synthase
VIGPDAWGRPNKVQPIILSLQLQIDRTAAGISDDIKDTFSYGQMYKDVLTEVEGKEFQSIDHLTSSLSELLNRWPGKILKIQALAPNSILRVEGGLAKEWYSLRGMQGLPDHAWVIKGLKAACIIGVNPHERLEKQSVTMNLRIAGETESAAYERQRMQGEYSWARLAKRVCDVVEASSYETLEALSTLIAKTALEEFPIPQIGVHVEKPSALMFVEGAGVEITRDRQWLESLNPSRVI